MSLTDAARYRLAALGLGAVLLLLGGFVIVSATITRSGADRLERETTVAWAFERARSAVALQEAHVAQAAANGDHRWLRDRIGEDADRLSGALDDVRRVGESLDRDAAERIAVEEERYVEAVAAGAAADPEPLRELTAATADERSTLLEHVGGFRRSGDTVFVVTILAFALGYALLSVFGGIMRRIQQRRQRAERDRREALEGMATVAEVSRQIGAGSDARADVCAAACRVGRADFAMLLEPRDATTLACSAASGVEATGLVIDPGSGRSAAHDTLRSGETRLRCRCAGDPTLNPR
jgi:hypothetical protein